MISQGEGQSLKDARLDAIDGLLINLGDKAGVKLSSRTKAELKSELEQSNEGVNLHESNIQTSTFNIDREEIKVSFVKVGEYYEYDRGYYHLWELYEVSNSGSFKAYIPEYTDRYGPDAGWKSALLPGWGQFYKGNTLKGVLLLTAEAVSVSGLAYSESRRSDNMRMSMETTNMTLVKEYRSRADSWEQRRNILIGTSIGIYVLNILDAALAKGKIKYLYSGKLHFTASNIQGNSFYGLAYNF
jgi:hypothetical protein